MGGDPRVLSGLLPHGHPSHHPYCGTHADWNTTVINRDVAERLTTMKAQPGGAIILTGGSTG